MSTELETYTMADFVRDYRIRMSAERCSENPHMVGSQNMDHWKVVIHMGRKRLTTYYSMGYGHKGRTPDVGEVLDCLATDTGYRGLPFEEFCADLGYDTDSRQAEHTYQALLKSEASLRRFLGEPAFTTLVSETERL